MVYLILAPKYSLIEQDFFNPKVVVNITSPIQDFYQ